jgi:hypothetical protein
MRAYNNEDGGACFEIKLPLAPTQNAAPEAREGTNA